MKLVLERRLNKRGHSDEWMATIEGMKFPGIGRTRTDALGSLLSANLHAFGVTERVDIDPEAEEVEITWRASNGE
jgi:hypothetical protein